MDIADAVHQRIREMSTKPRHVAAVQILTALASDPRLRVLRWIENNHEKLRASSTARTPADEAWSLAQWVANRQPLTQWERLPTVTRKRRLGRIDNLATNLAKLLHQADSPPVPAAIDLFQRDRLPARWSQTGLWQADVVRLREQNLAAMLARLAWFARGELGGLDTGNSRRQARPLTGDADRRAFVCEIADWFSRRYRTKSAEVVADVINVAAPDSEVAFDGKKVRQCLSSR